jgi:hypothetical protein
LTTLGGGGGYLTTLGGGGGYLTTLGGGGGYLRWWRVLDDLGRWWRVLDDLGRWWRVRDDLGGWWRVLDDLGGWWRVLDDLGGWWRVLDLLRIKGGERLNFATVLWWRGNTLTTVAQLALWGRHGGQERKRDGAQERTKPSYNGDSSLGIALRVLPQEYVNRVEMQSWAFTFGGGGGYLTSSGSGGGYLTSCTSRAQTLNEHLRRSMGHLECHVDVEQQSSM